MNKRQSNPARNKELCVAQFANPKRRETKEETRLNVRRADYSRLIDTKSMHGGVQQRKETGGFHRPGSNQR